MTCQASPGNFVCLWQLMFRIVRGGEAWSRQLKTKQGEPPWIMKCTRHDIMRATSYCTCARRPWQTLAAEKCCCDNKTQWRATITLYLSQYWYCWVAILLIYQIRSLVPTFVNRYSSRVLRDSLKNTYSIFPTELSHICDLLILFA